MIIRKIFKRGVVIGGINKYNVFITNKHTNIMCQVDGDETNIRIITLYTGDYFYDRSGSRYSEVVPIDTKGIPLTEDVLNETI